MASINPAGIAASLVEQRYLASEMFGNAFSDAAIGMALVGVDGRWLKVNDSLCRMLGYSSQELLQIDVQSLTHQDDLTRGLSHATALLLGHIPSYRLEKRYFHKSGRVICVLVTGSVVRKRDGTPNFFIAQLQDITAQKRADADREALFELSGSLLAVLTADLVLVRVNSFWKERLGSASAEQSLLDLVHDDDRDRTATSIDAAQTGNQAQEVCNRIRRASGGYCTVEWRIVHSASGDLLIEGRDITDRQRRADYEAATSTLLHELADHVPAIIGYFDAGLVNRYANARTLDWFGVTPEQLNGRTLREILGDEAYEHDRKLIEAALNGEQQVVRGRLPATGQRGELEYIVFLTPSRQHGEVTGLYVLGHEARQTINLHDAL